MIQLRKTTGSTMECCKNFMRKPLVRTFLAEMLGTFILVLFGCGSVAQASMRKILQESPLQINIGFFVGLMFAVYVAGGISGGHVNPAVSLAMACLGKLKWLHFIVYVIAQFLGAFVGAAAVYGVYYDKLSDFITHSEWINSASIFASYPVGPLSILGGLFDQVMGTAMLVLGILAVTDQRNIGAPRGMEPICVGLVLLGISVSMGLNCGFPLNPARDLGPRLFAAVAGWGTEVFSTGNHWWWVPVVGPMIGGPIGALLYYLVTKRWGKGEEEEEAEDEESESE